MTGRKSVLGSDLKKVDAHKISREEYKEIPELTHEFLARAVLHEGGRPVRRGRPPSKHRKVPVNLRLSREVLSFFRAGGPGWQTRINAELEQALARQRKKARR
jgi:uncharacterized protein (DUF4415 family)